MSLDVPALLGDAQRALEEAGVRYAVIGGCARNAYAEPRATKDVDFVVDADAATYPAVVRALASRGFLHASAVTDPDSVVPDLALYRDAAGRRIDILFAKTSFERAALDRSATATPYVGLALPVVSPEDLLVYKLVAGRTQDLADVREIVMTFRSIERAIDWIYVEGWCDAWEVRPRLDRLRAELAAE